MVWCEVIKTREYDNKGTYELTIDYFGMNRKLLLTSKAQSYLYGKTGLSLAYKGDRVDVIRSVQPKKNNPNETFECFKVVKIMRKNTNGN